MCTKHANNGHLSWRNPKAIPRKADTTKVETDPAPRGPEPQGLRWVHCPQDPQATVHLPRPAEKTCHSFGVCLVSSSHQWSSVDCSERPRCCAMSPQGNPSSRRCSSCRSSEGSQGPLCDCRTRVCGICGWGRGGWGGQGGGGRWIGTGPAPRGR